MKMRPLWLSMARSMGFAVVAALICRLFFPVIKPGLVNVPVREANLPRGTRAPTPTPYEEPTPTATPARPNAERWRRKHVDDMSNISYTYEEEVGQAQIYNARTETYHYDAGKLARAGGRARAHLRHLLRTGIDINGYTTEGNTPLCRAAASDNPYPLRLLLSLGADPNRRDESGLSPLEATVYDGQDTYFHLETLAPLLRAGADPNRRFSDGRTPLNTAIELDTGEHEAVELLLKAGANVNLPDRDGSTPLMNATVAYVEPGTHRHDHDPRHQPTWVLQQLLARGAVVNARDHRGQTALMHNIAYQGQMSRQSVYYEDETPPKSRWYGIYNVATVRFLLAHGADSNLRDGTGRTALHYAVLSLPQRHDDYYYYEYDDGYQDSGMKERVEVVKALLAGGAQVDARDRQGRTPLIDAMELYYLAVNEAQVAILPLKALVAGGADVNARDEHGASALYLGRREPVVTQLLRAHGAR